MENKDFGTGNNIQQGQQQNNLQIQEGQQQEKMFSQDEVNRMIAARLARVKNDSAAELDERTAELNKRELMLDAREKLADAGLPKELMSAINCNSQKEMEDSILALSTFLKGGVLKPERSRYQVSMGPGMKPNANGTYTVSTGISNGIGGGGGTSSEDAAIRKAMGLKG